MFCVLSYWVALQNKANLEKLPFQEDTKVFALRYKGE